MKFDMDILLQETKMLDYSSPQILDLIRERRWNELDDEGMKELNRRLVETYGSKHFVSVFSPLPKLSIYDLSIHKTILS